MREKNRLILLFLLIINFLSGCSANNNTEEDTSKSGPNSSTSTPTQITAAPITVTPISAAPSPTTSPASEPENPNTVSSYTTVIHDKDENRVHNIKIAAEDLDGTVIEPGEVFSFNKTVGRRSEEKGYEEAPIFVDGEKDTGIGGGVCQVSTTLYNAALEADLEIVERHRHSREVSYVPEGKDATVVYNSKDLKFKNTKDYPIEIRVSVSEDEVKVMLIKKAE